ncbi:host attachment protein [Roseovarius aestuariivivens]|uniref:baeRF12 domain-containing protein n=1 Tax=Roseovarius aestuariivivens TaxID=1888910 RepID=UPI0010802E81|nr:host attachment family protein [Roseovarius aestuariivivens]
MTELKHGTWVLIADGEKALFLRNDLDEMNPDLNVVREEEQDNPADSEQGTDSPGRMQDTGIQQMSALDETDWHQLAKDRFASDLADILYKYAHKNAFERLVVCAPPNTLGELRQHFHKEVQSRIIAEVDKDFTNHPLDEVEKLLKSELASG